MELGLEGKVILVTGGAKGIGAAIARGLAAEKALPVILDRDGESADALVQELGSGLALPVELTEEEAIRQVVATAREECGRIDGVVNNAGVNDGVGLERPPGEFLESLTRTLFHVFAVVHHALPDLEDSKGAIVNIGSKVATTGQGGTSGYAAAKGGVNGLTREWAVALAPFGVRVNCICPAEVMTPMYRDWLATLPDPEATQRKIEASIPLGQRFTKPEEIADLAVLLLSARSSHTTGQILFPDGGYTHLDRACTK